MRILQISIASSPEKVVKCINFEPLHAHSNLVFKSSHLLKLEDLLNLNILSFVYKTINNLTPPCFQGHFIYNSNLHGYDTRQVERGDLYKKHRNTTMSGSFNEISWIIIMEQWPYLYSRFTISFIL